MASANDILSYVKAVQGEYKKQKTEDVLSRVQAIQDGKNPDGSWSIAKPNIPSSTANIYDRALESYYKQHISDPDYERALRNGEILTTPEEGPGYVSDKLDAWIEQTGQKMDQNYNAVAQWYGEAGTEQNRRRHALVQAMDQMDKDTARAVWNGERELTGTVQAMSNERLAELGYNRGEISIARQMMDLQDEMGLYDEGRRVGQTLRGTVVTIASAVPQIIETAKQGYENFKTKSELSAGDDEASKRIRSLIRSIEHTEDTVVQEFYQGRRALTGTVEEMANQVLQERGYTPEEISEARQMLETPAAPVSQDTLGYQMYQVGQEALEDAMRGESAGQQFVHGAVTSASENLVLAAINPALVLPVLTLQGMADNLAEGTASGQSAGHSLTSAAIKGGIGWIIEEAGVAQMAANMGKPFASSAVAQKILQWMRSAPGMATLQESSPLLYGLVASATDEGLEEFVEAYADKIVDVALGDADQSELVGMELLAEAGRNAASGALGGAMIGGVSSGIGMLSPQEMLPDEAPVQLAQEQAAQAAQQQEAPAAQVEQAPTPQTPASAALSAQLDELQQATAPEAPAVPADPQLLTPQTAAASDLQTAAGAPLAESMETTSRPTAPAAADYGWAEEMGRQAAEEGILGEAAWAQLRQNAEARNAQAEAQPGAETITQAPAAQLEEDSQPVQIDPRWSAAQQQEARLLAESSSLSADAVELVVDAMPGGISPEIYTDAARQLYQIARQGIATEEADALDLAQRFGVKVGQVMAVPGGPEALHQVWNQGRIEGLAVTGYGQAGFAPEKTAGTVTVEPGAQLPAEDLQLIDLAARATDTAVTIKDRLENGAGGAIDTALGKIYFAAEQGQDTLGAVLHEELHLYNALDPEGGRQLQQTALRYLAESQGFESVDRMLVGYVEQLQQVGQEITYSQAAEELVADAMRGVFSDVKSFVRWVKSQKAQAAKNAESRGIVSKTMDAVKKLLNQIIQKAKAILARQPDNQAARWAQSLAEEQRQELERLWYQHQDTALDNQRAMRASGTKSTSERATDSAARYQMRNRENTDRYPQARWTGKGDAAYETLTALPDMEITPIDTRAVEGKNYREIVTDAFENMGLGRDVTQATVTNRYTGMEITIKRQSIEHSFNAGRQIKTRGPYVEKIGSILENAVKVNELDGRTGSKGRGEDRSDVYLGAAENEKGELVGVRLIVNVFKNGKAELDTSKLQEETGRLYAHLGTKIGSAEAPPAGAPAFEAGGHAVSRSPLQGPRASTAEAKLSHTISIADLIGAVNETRRVEGRRNVVNWLEGVLSEDVRENIGSTVERPVDMADSLRYHLPIEPGSVESGKRAAAWEGADKAGLVEYMEQQRSDWLNLSAEDVKQIASKICSQAGSKANRIEVAKRIWNLVQYMNSGKANYDVALVVAEDIMDFVMQSSGKLDRELYNQYPDLHNFTIGLKRGRTLYNDLSATYGSYQLAQKELSRFHITLTTAKPKPGESVRSADQLYQELSKDYPGLFPADKVNPLDQIQQIATVREMITPEWRNNFGEGYDEAKADLALQLMIELSQKGGAMDTAASALRQRFSEALGGLRQNSEARMLNALATQEKQLRERYRKSQDATRKLFQETTARMGAAYTAKLQRAQARSQGALQRAWDARSRDSILRSIASDRVKLTRMLEHPTEKNHVPQQYLETALEIADLANAAAYNKEAVTRLKALAADIEAAATADDGVDSMAADYKQSGIEEMLGRLTNSMDTELLRSQRAEDALYKASRRVRQSSKQLKAQQQAQADLVQSMAQGQGRMTNEQLITLHDLLQAMVTLAQNSNKLMAAKTNLAASEFAINAVNDVSNSPYKLGKAPGAAKLLFGKYQANVLNATRSLKRMGGYIHGGAMEVLADALKNGEAEVIRLREKGAQIFRAEIENQKALKKFAGKNATLYDIGLKSEEGESVLVNMAQIVSIYKHLQHPQNREHLTKGGLKVPDMKLYSAGKIEEAYRKSVLAHLDLSGDPVARIEGLMDDYAAAWSKDLDELLNKYTKEIINRTSRRLSGYDKAKVENYYPIQVDSDVLAKEMEGVVYNGTIEGRGFLKERRQNAPQPILLEECTSVALRSLTDAATYGGLAPVIRDANKIWNANRGEFGSLKAAVRKSFGTDGVQVFEDYLTDLQRQPRGRRSLFDFFKGIRGRYAGAVLTYNFPSLLGQISGVAALGSELGGKATWDAYKSFFEMATGKERLEAVLQEMRDHDFWAVENTMSTGASAELAALRNRTGKIGEIIENLPGANLLEKVDILTRASAWEGAKSRVNQDLEAYGLTEEEVESDAWWDAVAGLAGQALENTQPNYTISQQAAIQRNPDQLYKMLTMFRTPAFQNYGVLSYAIEDYAAQRGYRQQVEQRLAEETLSDAARQKLEQQRAEYAAQEQAASGRLKMAVGAQILQSVIYAVAAGMLGKDWLLHNLDREKDENGNFTVLSVGGRLTSLTAESLLGNVYGLQEAWNTIGNIFGDGSSDPISLTGIDAISDFAGDLRRLNSEWNKFAAADTAEKDWLTLWNRSVDVCMSLGNLTGIPAGQVQRLFQSAYGWAKDFYTAASNEDVSFGDILTAPESSSSQYDRLYAAAFENADPDEVETALGKLDQLDRITPPAKAGDAKAGDKRILSEMISREKAYGDTLSAAAAARIAGREQEYQQAFQALVNRLAAALGIDSDNPGSDRPRLNAVIDKASSAISDEVKRQLGQDSETGATIYDKVFAALDAGGNVRAELEALRRAGIQDDSIRNAVSGRYKQAYIDGDAADRDDIAAQLLRLVDAEGEPYYTRKEMDGWASDAALKGFNPDVYTDLDEALSTRNLVSAQEQIDRYLAAGKSDESIRTRITAMFRKAYLAAQGSERAELGKFLCRLKGSRGALITPDTLTGWIKDAAKDKTQ